MRCSYFLHHFVNSAFKLNKPVASQVFNYFYFAYVETPLHWRFYATHKMQSVVHLYNKGNLPKKKKKACLIFKLMPHVPLVYASNNRNFWIYLGQLFPLFLNMEKCIFFTIFNNRNNGLVYFFLLLLNNEALIFIDNWLRITYLCVLSQDVRLCGKKISL